MRTISYASVVRIRGIRPNYYMIIIAIIAIIITYYYKLWFVIEYVFMEIQIYSIMIEEDFVMEIQLVDMTDWEVEGKQQLREQRQGDVHGTHERRIQNQEDFISIPGHTRATDLLRVVVHRLPCSNKRVTKNVPQLLFPYHLFSAEQREGSLWKHKSNCIILSLRSFNGIPSQLKKNQPPCPTRWGGLRAGLASISDLSSYRFGRVAPDSRRGHLYFSSSNTLLNMPK